MYFGNNNNYYQSPHYQNQLKDAQIKNQQNTIDQYKARPVLPAWESLANSDGTLQSQYQTQDSFDRSALNQLKTEGLRGPETQSKWRQLMGEQLDYNTNQQLGSLASQSQATAGHGLNQIAQRGGGYSSGASERLMENANRNALLAGQGVRNNAFNQRIGLDVQDESNRRQDLQTLNQSLFTDAQYKSGLQDSNINRSILEKGMERQFEQNAYNQQMQAWAADQTADATEKAGRAKQKPF